MAENFLGPSPVGETPSLPVQQLTPEQSRAYDEFHALRKTIRNSPISMRSRTVQARLGGLERAIRGEETKFPLQDFMQDVVQTLAHGRPLPDRETTEEEWRDRVDRNDRALRTAMSMARAGQPVRGDLSVGELAKVVTQELYHTARRGISGAMADFQGGYTDYTASIDRDASQKLAALPPDIAASVSDGSIGETIEYVMHGENALLNLGFHAIGTSAGALGLGAAAAVGGKAAGLAKLGTMIAGGVGAGVGGWFTEYIIGHDEALSRMGVDPNDTEAKIAAYKSPEFRDQIRKAKATKASVIAATEGVGLFLGGKVFGPFERMARKTLMGKAAREGINFAGQTVVQSGLEGGGELLGQLAAFGDYEMSDVLLETIAGGMLAGPTIAVGRGISALGDQQTVKRNKKKTKTGDIRDGLKTFSKMAEIIHEAQDSAGAARAAQPIHEEALKIIQTHGLDRARSVVSEISAEHGDTVYWVGGEALDGANELLIEEIAAVSGKDKQALIDAAREGMPFTIPRAEVAVSPRLTEFIVGAQEHVKAASDTMSQFVARAALENEALSKENITDEIRNEVHKIEEEFHAKLLPKFGKHQAKAKALFASRIFLGLSHLFAANGNNASPWEIYTSMFGGFDTTGDRTKGHFYATALREAAKAAADIEDARTKSADAQSSGNFDEVNRLNDYIDLKTSSSASARERVSQANIDNIRAGARAWLQMIIAKKKGFGFDTKKITEKSTEQDVLASLETTEEINLYEAAGEVYKAFQDFNEMQSKPYSMQTAEFQNKFRAMSKTSLGARVFQFAKGKGYVKDGSSKTSVNPALIAFEWVQQNPEFYARDPADDVVMDGDEMGLADNATRIIHLFENSDFSTLVHEMAHISLEIMRHMDRGGKMDPEQREILFEFLGIRGWDELNIQEYGEIARERHERWAETVELYARTGEAPSKLRNILAAIAMMMATVYRTYVATNEASKIDPKAKEFLDRFLMAEHEARKSDPNFKPVSGTMKVKAGQAALKRFDDILNEGVEVVRDEEEIIEDMYEAALATGPRMDTAQDFERPDTIKQAVEKGNWVIVQTATATDEHGMPTWGEGPVGIREKNLVRHNDFKNAITASLGSEFATQANVVIDDNVIASVMLVVTDDVDSVIAQAHETLGETVFYQTPEGVTRSVDGIPQERRPATGEPIFNDEARANANTHYQLGGNAAFSYPLEPSAKQIEEGLLGQPARKDDKKVYDEINDLYKYSKVLEEGKPMEKGSEFDADRHFATSLPVPLEERASKDQVEKWKKEADDYASDKNANEWLARRKEAFERNKPLLSNLVGPAFDEEIVRIVEEEVGEMPPGVPFMTLDAGVDIEGRYENMLSDILKRFNNEPPNALSGTSISERTQEMLIDASVAAKAISDGSDGGVTYRHVVTLMSVLSSSRPWHEVLGIADAASKIANTELDDFANDITEQPIQKIRQRKDGSMVKYGTVAELETDLIKRLWSVVNAPWDELKEAPRNNYEVAFMRAILTQRTDTIELLEGDEMPIITPDLIALVNHAVWANNSPYIKAVYDNPFIYKRYAKAIEDIVKDSVVDRAFLHALYASVIYNESIRGLSSVKAAVLGAPYYAKGDEAEAVITGRNRDLIIPEVKNIITRDMSGYGFAPDQWAGSLILPVEYVDDGRQTTRKANLLDYGAFMPVGNTAETRLIPYIETKTQNKSADNDDAVVPNDFTTPEGIKHALTRGGWGIVGLSSVSDLPIRFFTKSSTFSIRKHQWPQGNKERKANIRKDLVAEFGEKNVVDAVGRTGGRTPDDRLLVLADEEKIAEFLKSKSEEYLVGSFTTNKGVMARIRSPEHDFALMARWAPGTPAVLGANAQKMLEFNEVQVGDNPIAWSVPLEMAVDEEHKKGFPSEIMPADVKDLRSPPWQPRSVPDTIVYDREGDTDKDPNAFNRYLDFVFADQYKFDASAVSRLVSGAIMQWWYRNKAQPELINRWFTPDERNTSLYYAIPYAIWDGDTRSGQLQLHPSEGYINEASKKPDPEVTDVLMLHSLKDTRSKEVDQRYTRENFSQNPQEMQIPDIEEFAERWKDVYEWREHAPRTEAQVVPVAAAVEKTFIVDLTPQEWDTLKPEKGWEGLFGEFGKTIQKELNRVMGDITVLTSDYPEWALTGLMANAFSSVLLKTKADAVLLKGANKGKDILLVKRQAANQLRALHAGFDKTKDPNFDLLAQTKTRKKPEQLPRFLNDDGVFFDRVNMTDEQQAELRGLMRNMAKTAEFSGLTSYVAGGFVNWWKRNNASPLLRNRWFDIGMARQDTRLGRRMDTGMPSEIPDVRWNSDNFLVLVRVEHDDEINPLIEGRTANIEDYRTPWRNNDTYVEPRNQVAAAIPSDDMYVLNISMKTLEAEGFEKYFGKALGKPLKEIFNHQDVHAFDPYFIAQLFKQKRKTLFGNKKALTVFIYRDHQNEGSSHVQYVIVAPEAQHLVRRAPANLNPAFDMDADLLAQGRVRTPQDLADVIEKASPTEEQADELVEFQKTAPEEVRISKTQLEDGHAWYNGSAFIFRKPDAEPRSLFQSPGFWLTNRIDEAVSYAEGHMEAEYVPEIGNFAKPETMFLDRSIVPEPEVAGDLIKGGVSRPPSFEGKLGLNEQGDEKPTVFPNVIAGVVGNIKNPLIFDNYEGYDAMPPEMIEDVFEGIEDAGIDHAEMYRRVFEGEGMTDDEAELVKDYYETQIANLEVAGPQDVVVWWAFENGYDMVYFEQSDWVVLKNPETQLKSILWREGPVDPLSENIYAQRRENLGKKADRHKPEWHPEGLTDKPTKELIEKLDEAVGEDVTFRYNVNKSKVKPRTAIRYTMKGSKKKALKNPTPRGFMITEATPSARMLFTGELIDRSEQERAAEEGLRNVHAVLRGELLPWSEVPEIPKSGKKGWRRVTYFPFGIADGGVTPGFYFADDIPHRYGREMGLAAKHGQPVSTTIGRFMRESHRRLLQNYVGHELIATGSGYWISTTKPKSQILAQSKKRRSPEFEAMSKRMTNEAISETDHLKVSELGTYIEGIEGHRKDLNVKIKNAEAKGNTDLLRSHVRDLLKATKKLRSALKHKQESEMRNRAFNRWSIIGDNKRSGIDEKWIGPILSTLADYGLARQDHASYGGADEFFVARSREGIPIDEKQRPSKKPASELTMKEEEDLYQFLRAAVTAGRREMETKPDLEEHVNAVVNAIKSPKKRDKEALNAFMKGMRFLSDHGQAALLTAQTIFQDLDGGEQLGFVHRTMMDPVEESTNEEAKLFEEMATQIMDVYKTIPRGVSLNPWEWSSTADTHGFSREKMFAIALNWGTVGGREALLNGSRQHLGLNNKTAQDIINAITDKEWDAIERIWRISEKYWDVAADLEMETKGVRPRKINRAPFVVKGADGKDRIIKGGIYPILYDWDLQVRPHQTNVREKVNYMLRGGAAVAHTSQGRAQERMGILNADRRVALHIGAFAQHMADLAHDITHRKNMLRVLQIASHPRFRARVAQSLGSEVPDAISHWAESVIAGEMVRSNIIERGLLWARAGILLNSLGFSGRTALSQSLGIFAIIGHVGTKYARKGVANVIYSDGDALAAKLAWISSVSPQYRARRKSFDRDLVEARHNAMVKGHKYLRTGMSNAAYWAVGHMDALTSAVAFMAAYLKAKDEGKTEAKAIRLGDISIVRTQASGRQKDLNMLLKGGAFVKMSTMWATAFSGIFQTAAIAVKQRKYGASRKWVAGRIMATIVIPGVIGALAFERIDWDAEADEDDLLSIPPWAWQLIGGIAYEAAGQIIVVREFVNALFNDNPNNKSQTPVSRLIDDAAQAVEGVPDLWPGGDPPTLKFFKAISYALGVALQWPTMPFYRIAEAYALYNEGDITFWQAVWRAAKVR